MDTVREQEAARSHTPEPEQEDWFDWVRAHGESQPGWEAHRIVLALFDPIPPPTSRPTWLLAELAHGDPLTLRRLELPRRASPEFRVITQSGRDLGRISGTPAAMIEFALSEGIRPDVCVLSADPALPPEGALQLHLEIVAWFAPGERVEPPLVFDERLED